MARTSDDLERLKTLVLREGWDEDSRRQVEALERQFYAAAAKELPDHPAIKAYQQYLKDEIARCKELLSEHEDLTELARVQLFERKKACRDFLAHFGDTSQLEKTIKQLLDVAKNS